MDNRDKLGIDQYFNRRGTDAQGAADEWLDATQKDIQKTAATLSPDARNGFIEGMRSFVAGNYQNLKAYERREVRSGKIREIEETGRQRGIAISNSAITQIKADSRQREDDLTRVGKTYDEMIRRSTSDEERAAVEGWKKGNLEVLATQRMENIGTRISEVVARIEQSEDMIDAGIAQGLFDRVEASARKSAGARNIFKLVIGDLTDSGSYDEAEAFIGALEENEKQIGPSKDPKKPSEVNSFSLAKRYGFDSADISKLKESVFSARFERLTNSGTAAAMNAQLDDVKDANGNVIPGLESTIRDLKTFEQRLPIGSKARADAAKVAAQFDQAADKSVQFDLMNDLANGKNLLMSDGKTPIFDPNSRQARLFPAVYQAFTEKRQKAFNKGFRAAREQNLLDVEGKMMEFAAEGNPQGFYGYLADQVVAKKLTAGDFTRLRDEFNSGWMKGFKGSPDQLARQTSMAKNMLGLLRDRLGVDFSESVKKDDYGDPVLKNGTIDFDEKKELPTAEVKRQFKKTVRHGDIFLSFGSDIGTRKEEISGEQLKGILGQAMNLWSCNGMKITYDPVTGEDLPDGKTHTVNAERDFAALLDRVADEKNVLSAVETLKNQAAYAANVRMQAQVDADRRQKKMKGSTPVTDKVLEDKAE